VGLKKARGTLYRERKSRELDDLPADVQDKLAEMTVSEYGRWLERN
jgi:hypothetical protein